MAWSARVGACIVIGVLGACGTGGSGASADGRVEAPDTSRQAAPSTSGDPTSTSPHEAPGSSASDGEGVESAKELVADGKHWGCPGTFCGPTVSRFVSREYDPDNRRIVEAGTRIVALCVAVGSTITDPVANTATDLWIRAEVDDGYRWMSAHYFGTTDFESVVEGLSAC